MSEYFRKEIKKEFYPTPPYRLPHLATTSNSRPLLETASTVDLIIDNGKRLRTMIGMYFGARKNKSTGFSKSIAFNPTPKSIISEDGPNSAAKTCSAKTSKSSNAT